jgi:hypothetical protein
MERLLKKILSLSLLLISSTVLADCTSCDNGCNAPASPVTCFVPRSQSFHNELKNAVMDPDNQFLYGADTFNGSFNVMLEYNQTFDSDDLTRCLFGPAAVCVQNMPTMNNCCNDDTLLVLNIVGSQANTVTGQSNPNGITDLVADNFFLPKDFISQVTIEPSIQNFNIHLQAYFGFDEWCTGLYARIYTPLTVSRWKLKTNEKIISKGTIANGSYAAGEIAPVAVNPANLYGSFLSYTQGNTTPNFGQLPSTTTPPVVAGPTVQALRYTRFGGCDGNTTTQLADLRAEIGWNFVLDEDYHLGLYIAAAAPTANDCAAGCDGLLWGAKAGNGKHWELGGGLTAHWTICRSEDCEKQFDFFIDATINHMFAHTELRTFDLVNKPLSRYIIAEQLVSPATNGLNIGGTALPSQFAGAYAPIANFSTIPVSVSFPVQADVMAKFVYTDRGFSWAVGYDFWAQTCPSVDLSCNNECNAVAFPADTWALRGDAHVYGFANAGDGGANQGIQPIPATYNATTAFNIGTAFESGTPASANCGVDNSAAGARVTSPANDALYVTPGTTNNPICVSNPPVFIQQSDLNICNISRGMSNSIFTELNYTWIDRDCWVPYVGIGARIEFGSTSDSNVTNNVNAIPLNLVTNANGGNICCGNSCGTCTASVWGVWIRGGVSFN